MRPCPKVSPWGATKISFFFSFFPFSSGHNLSLLIWFHHHHHHESSIVVSFFFIRVSIIIRRCGGVSPNSADGSCEDRGRCQVSALLLRSHSSVSIFLILSFVCVVIAFFSFFFLFFFFCRRNFATLSVEQKLQFVGDETGKRMALREIISQVRRFDS